MSNKQFLQLIFTIEKKKKYYCGGKNEKNQQELPKK